MSLKQEEWAQLVEKWRASRQSAPVFAAGHGVTASALRYWSVRLERETRARSTSRPQPGARPPAVPVPPLARVVRPGEAPTTTGEGRITIVVGNVSIVVERGFDRVHLREVVRVLSEAE